MLDIIHTSIYTYTYTQPKGEKSMIEHFYTVREVAKVLRVSERTIFRYMQPGAKQKINAFKIGKSWRISETELNRFIETRNK